MTNLVQAIDLAQQANEKRIAAEIDAPKQKLDDTEALLILRQFAEWCRSRGVKWLPATPSSCAAWMHFQRVNHVAPETITKAIEAIQIAHDQHGYAKFDDDAGTHGPGQGVDAWGDNDAFLKPSWTGDVDNVNANHGYLIDNDPSLPSGKPLAGGGALSQKGGIGAGPPRHAPKNVGHAGQKNWDSRGGVNRGGRR